MAGGKETPRQKMIGMMYLVLTALLALQVSNAVLEKFAIINATLDGLIKTSSVKSDQILAAIIDEAGKSENAGVLKAKENAQKVRVLTKKTLDDIEKLKKKMLELSGAEKIDDQLINDHSSKVATMMIDMHAPEQEGKKYEKLLVDYVKELSDLSGVKFEKLNKSPKELELFKNDEKHANKDYLTFTFENTPPIAALASVTQTQTEILDYEAKALDKLREDAGANTVRFDKIVPMVRPKASIVAAGAKYEADMFITASSTAVIPEFFMNGNALPVIDDATGVKMGKVSFTAQGGGYNAEGLARKTFKAEIKIKGETYPQEVEYFVAQPIIKVTTGNVPSLYMNCGNTVNIEVPSLGTSYNPSFSSQGAEIRKGDKPGKVTIIPSQRKITVAVTNGGTLIGNQPFDAKNIPEPRFVAYIGSSPVDLRNGVKPNQLRNLRIVVEPDANFKEEVPKDARYNVKSMDVILGSGAAAKNRMAASNGSPDLGGWVGQAKPGDRVVFDIKDAIRKTFTDSEEKVPIKGSNGIIIIPIN